MSAELDCSQSPEHIRFRPMSLLDVPAVAAVELAAYPFPWSDGVFRDCVRAGYLCRVVESLGAIVGYGIMSFGAGEAHILNVCICPALRRQGVGRRLLNYLLEQATEAYMQDVFLEVRSSNTIAMSLYESLGFMRVGLRKAYYQATAGREDAVVYKLPLGMINARRRDR